ncbi:18177_t:CDS:2, partial [Gigaspora margarita]
AAKKTVPYFQIKKTVKAKQQKTAIAKAAIALGKLIRETYKSSRKNKSQQIPHSREDLEG